MKYITILLVFFTFSGQAQDNQFSFEEWQKESFENIRLLPRYGYIIKNATQLQADADFIEKARSMDNFIDMRTASNKYIELGFTYLYRGDLRTAMYRFNQAFLLDSTNTDDYWGYGAVYMQLGKPDLAEHQYRMGLSKDSLNNHLWTDLATIYSMRNNDTTALNTALEYLNKAYSIEPKDVNTVYKLSVSYYLKNDCSKAKRFFNECTALGGQPIIPEYKTALETLCK